METVGLTFNEIIKKQLAEDRNPLIPAVVDKVGLREYVSRMGYQCIPLLKDVVEEGEEVNTFVAKASNDSGSTYIAVDGKVIMGSKERLLKHQYVPYGVNKGEWFYEGIPFNLIMEQYMGPLTDYKWHCINGEVRFLHIIHDRENNPKQYLYDMEKNPMDYKFYHKMGVGEYPAPESWDRQVEIAKELSAAFGYVRVDLYDIDGEIYVGELTFAPGAGNYAGEGQRELGELLSSE